MAGGFDIHNIIWDKKTVIAVVAVSAVLLYGDIAFLMKMQLHGLITSGPKIKKLKKDIATLYRDLAAMRAAQQETEQQKGEHAQTKRLLKAEQLPTLLDKISLLGNIPGIKIMQIESTNVQEDARAVNPRGARPKANKPGQANAAPAPTPQAVFNESLLTLDVSCDYHKLGVFLNQVDQLPAVLFVQQLSIAPETNVRESVHLVLKVYVNK